MQCPIKRPEQIEESFQGEVLEGQHIFSVVIPSEDLHLFLRDTTLLSPLVHAFSYLSWS